MIFLIQSFQLNTDNFSLSKAGENLPVEPLVFDLVVFLIQNRERVLTRSEILDNIWANREVSDATLSNHINIARSLFGDDGVKQEVIKTVRGRGYQFIAKVTYPETYSAPAPVMAPTSASLIVEECRSPLKRKPLFLAWLILAIVTAFALGFIVLRLISESEKPIQTSSSQEVDQKSIAIIPFINRSNLQEDAFFTDGFHNDLLTQISKIDGIRTISRTSVMAYRDSTKDSARIAQELNVTTILEGGVQRAGNKVRINVQLIDALKDQHLWAETYTRDLNTENIFAIQTEITQAIVQQLQLVLNKALSRDDLPPTQNMAALEAWFNGIYQCKLDTSEGIAKSVEFFHQATELDSNFAEAYSMLAKMHLAQIEYGKLAVSEQIAKAEPLIEKALLLDPLLSEGYEVQGMMLGHQNLFAQAKAAYQKAIELNGNNANAYAAYGSLLIRQLNDTALGIKLIQKSVDLDPQNPRFRKILDASLLAPKPH